MDKTLKKRENDVLRKFEQFYKSKIACDGLHLLGDIFIENGYWDRNEGDEEEQWHNICAKKRGLVVITKELNDPDNPWDIRIETARKNFIENPTPTNILFYKNLRNWVYCLLHIDGRGNTPDCPSLEVAQECFENSPLVRINIKKSPGGGKTEYRSLKHIYKDEILHALVNEQLSIYKDASIYLDCSRMWGIKYLKELYPDLKAFPEGGKIKDKEKWIFYSDKNSFFVINSYHPSYRRLNGEYGDKYYVYMQEAIKNFFDAKPDFFK